MKNKRMDWKKLLSTKRVSELEGNKKDKPSQFNDPRSPFERDFDQITFSYPFRRLQDKTQVIPFPEFDFVHTRLTHSLEVASVGRSFGKLVADLIKEKEGEDALGENTSSDIGALIAAACLAHDIGNPPFGHSGEDSISNYFRQRIFKFKKYKEEGKYYHFNDYKEDKEKIDRNIALPEIKRYNDLSNFEGNANGFRIIANNYGRGINPTYALLGTFTKYPRESYLEKEPSNIKELKSQAKYGFFQAEKEMFKNIAEELGLIRIEDIGEDDIAYHRHPLAFLMEASDDIAYGMIDFEDGCRLGLIDFEKTYGTIKLRNKKNELEEKVINKSPKEILCNIAKKDNSFYEDKLKEFDDYKQQLSYLRSKVINVLIHKCFEVFKNNYNDIMEGKFDKDLISCIDKDIIDNLEYIKVLVRKYVYQHPPVLQSEASGFEVIEFLIKSFATTSNICFTCGEEETAKQKKMRSLLPEEFQPEDEIQVQELTEEDVYNRVLKILDYISGMTDKYAVHLYRRMRGIDI
jgi:putative dGTPase